MDSSRHHNPQEPAIVTAVCNMRPDDNEPTYRGYSLNTLVDHSTYEEVAYLLLYGRLPNAVEFEQFKTLLTASGDLPRELIDLLRNLPEKAHPLDVLRTAAAYLGAVDSEAGIEDTDAELRKAVRMIAKLPAAVAASFRITHHLDPVRPLRQLGYTRNFLTQISGYAPDDDAVQVLDAVFIVSADGEGDASSYSARVTASSLADVSSSITAAIGSLKGSLNGGGIGAVMRFLQSARESQQSGDAGALQGGALERIPGFFPSREGCADPKTQIIKRLSRRLGQRIGDSAWHRLCERIEEGSERSGFRPAASFYTGAIFLMLLIPDALAVSLIAAVRAAGWAAHCIEQRSLCRIINPSVVYCGPENLEYLPIARRNGRSQTAA